MNRPAGGKPRYRLRIHGCSLLAYWCELLLDDGTWLDNGWRYLDCAEAIRRAPR